MTQITFATLLALLSALLHAVLALQLKQAQDRLVFRGLLHFYCAVFALPFLMFVVPLPLIGFGFLFLSMLVHWFYQMFTIAAFERGDMGLVYPVMRGLAPMMVAIVAIFIVGEPISLMGAIGLVIIAISLMAFSWPSDAQILSKTNIAGLGFAALTAFTVAIYTNIDAQGARVTKEALSYIIWFFVLDAPSVIITACIRRRNQFFDKVKLEVRRAALGAVAAMISYGGFIYAASIAPVAQMSAMRETSVVWGALFATLILGEPFGFRRIIFAIILVIGLVLLRIS